MGWANYLNNKLFHIHNTGRYGLSASAFSCASEPMRDFVVQPAPTYLNIFLCYRFKMLSVKYIACLVWISSLVLKETGSIKCFQCSSTEDQRKPTGVWSEDHYTQNRYEDNCGVYWPFEPERNVPVECNSDESHTPGTFCVKITKQGPRGFIWDGRWRQVIRRCASVSDTGVTGVCNWGVQANGVYWEECYCSNDGCNAATGIM